MKAKEMVTGKASSSDETPASAASTTTTKVAGPRDIPANMDSEYAAGAGLGSKAGRTGGGI